MKSTPSTVRDADRRGEGQAVETTDTLLHSAPPQHLVMLALTRAPDTNSHVPAILQQRMSTTNKRNSRPAASTLGTPTPEYALARNAPLMERPLHA